MHSILIAQLFVCAVFSDVGLAKAAYAFLVALARVGLITRLVILLGQSLLLDHQRLVRLGLLNQIFLKSLDFIFEYKDGAAGVLVDHCLVFDLF